MINNEIDIMKLYSGQIKGFEDHAAWNNWLSECLINNKINELVTVMNGLQRGMASAEKKKLTNESIINTYCRWIGSIDKTIRRIMKKNNSNFVDPRTKFQANNDLEKYLKKQMY